MTDVPPAQDLDGEQLIEGAHITWNAPNDEHPARRAAQRSAYNACHGLKDAWVALFSEGAVVEDPVGPSWFDPAGEGHRGHAGIAAFYDKAIAGLDAMHFRIDASYANGNTCANVGAITNTMGGREIVLDLVMVYTVDDSGLITSIRAHWDPKRLLASMR